MMLNTPEESKLFKAGEKGTMTVFPMINVMLTGVVSIFHNAPRYLITYSDGTAEETVYESDNLDFHENLFDFVSTLQNHSRK